jgi:peroxidase
MAMATPPCRTMILMAFVAAAMIMASQAQSPLQYNFYGSSCPQAEATVRNVTEGIIRNDPTMGAAFMRLFFHDCFVRVMNLSTNPIEIISKVFHFDVLVLGKHV